MAQQEIAKNNLQFSSSHTNIICHFEI